MDTGQENVPRLLAETHTNGITTWSPEDRCAVVRWPGEEGVCLLNDRAILMAPSCSW